MRAKRNLIIGAALVSVVAATLVWLRWGPDSWDVQISGVTGDGQGVQYRIETLHAGTADSLIFKNKDAGFAPPYFKFASADLQAVASRIARECSEEVVKVHGYGLRIPILDMFPNATAIDAPLRCREAPSEGSAVAGTM